MKQSIYSQLFSKLGLSDAQAKVYELLIKNGNKTAGEISKKTNIKRGLTYNALSELEKKGLISQNKKTKIITFSPNHPETLRDYIENKEKEVRDIKTSFESVLPSIISDFNQISSKPGIRYYEGYAGVTKVFNEFLDNAGKNKVEILNFSYLEDYMNDKELMKIGMSYAKKRINLKIHQKTILPDNNKTLDFVKDNTINTEHYEETRYVNSKKFPFKSDIMIYDNKFLMVSIKNGTPISIIIENEELTKTMSSIFQIVWEN